MKYSKLKQLSLALVSILSVCAPEVSAGPFDWFINREEKLEEKSQDVCRAISLSGGGAKGAYEVGALYEMTRLLDPSELEYDVISGISVGAINAAALAIHEKGKIKEAAQFLYDMWMNLTSDQVYESWDGFEPY